MYWKVISREIGKFNNYERWTIERCKIKKAFCTRQDCSFCQKLKVVEWLIEKYVKFKRNNSGERRAEEWKERKNEEIEGEGGERRDVCWSEMTEKCFTGFDADVLMERVIVVSSNYACEGHPHPQRLRWSLLSVGSDNDEANPLSNHDWTQANRIFG